MAFWKDFGQITPSLYLSPRMNTNVKAGNTMPGAAPLKPLITLSPEGFRLTLYSPTYERTKFKNPQASQEEETCTH